MKIFWDVDTQLDFMNENGRLPVPDAHEIRHNLKKLTQYAVNNKIKLIKSMDYHIEYDKEISDTPDFKTTFPMHCEEGSIGACFIRETTPSYSSTYMVNYNNPLLTSMDILENDVIVIRKNKFDVFEGNHWTEGILNFIDPLKEAMIYVYGVAIDVCVDFAVMGNLKHGRKVFPVVDAMRGINNDVAYNSNLLRKWIDNGAICVSTKEILKGWV